MPQPDGEFGYIRADEVAECWEGVDDDLYRTLWKIVELMPSMKDLEEPVYGPPYCLSHYWDKLSEEDQVKLNELAIKHKY
jgi:hypothetical protein